MEKFNIETLLRNAERELEKTGLTDGYRSRLEDLVKLCEAMLQEDWT